MKQSFHLTASEIEKAIAEHVFKKVGRSGNVRVYLSAEQATDSLDRPIGGYRITATAEINE